MSSVATQILPVSKASLWIGRGLSGLISLFVVFDAILHLMVPAPVVEAFTRLGFPLDASVTLGVIELVCVVLYAIPGTAVLGAALTTAYFGGAIAVHLRAHSSLFETIFPILLAALLWGGLYLREPRLRGLIPWRQQ